MEAAAVNRSQSPDVFKRLSMTPTASAVARTSPLRNSESPQSWQETLRDANRESPTGRSRSNSHSRSNSRSRSCSPSRGMQQQPEAEHTGPWLTAGSKRSVRHSFAPPSPGPQEWDAETRSVKASAADNSTWGSPGSGSRGRSLARSRQQQQEEKEREQQQREEAAFLQKQPLKLPAHVIEERMRRFYARNVDWKQRCAKVYDRQREELKQGETKGCTFAPAINKKSERIAQVSKLQDTP
jgi:hypothetical protein